MGDKILVDLSVLDDTERAAIPPKPTPAKRKIPAVLRPELTNEDVIQGIRSGDFVPRAKEGRADYWKNFSEVVDSVDGTATGYNSCSKCQTPFKHGPRGCQKGSREGLGDFSVDSIRDIYTEVECVLRTRNELEFLPAGKELLDEFARFLKPFKDATLALSADKTPTLHLVALHYFSIIQHVNNFESTVSPALTVLCIHAKKVVTAKLVLDDIHKVAVFLNPATRHLPTFTELEKPAIISLVRVRLAKLLKKHPVAQSVLAEKKSSPVLAEKKSSSGIDDLLLYADSSVSEGKDEIDVYLKLPAPDKKRNLLQLWEDYKEALPSLSQLASRVLRVPAASTTSGRLFSDAGNIFTDRRTRLGAQKLDDLLFLKWNLTPDH
ncbi:hypothetical protein BV898_08602 [Hypsibius exemplaris]|uniref:HAT C-terminal dimerisation domain-containing protein n=1 Tax=Hypsibius exemplaris TaxID=2072580 RepID=A0A1W0WQC6_HYPEX|nr:hypothetical protein BV898_08602 [Hypsibius exemplaris]